ncbi:MAG: hypothetical protein NVSMB67_27130 [Flavisolibacter sp.]
MRYKFSKALQIDYSELKKFINSNEEISKSELLERSCGEINLELLHVIKEFGFDKIGKNKNNELYLK